MLLEDGTRLDGEAVGATGPALGEVVFNTAMTGYQEAVTDPSYAGQIITFTYPLIGNYGVWAQAVESDRVHARAVIMREAIDAAPAGSDGSWLDWLAAHGVAGDQRRRHARPGAPHPRPGRDARRRLPRRHAGGGGARADRGRALDAGPRPGARGHARGAGRGRRGRRRPARRRARHRHQELDRAQPAASAACRSTLLPCTTSADEVLEHEPDAVFLANGPGDPAALDYVVGTVRELVGKVPVFGICLGHQLLCRAVGLETFKLPFGHRGANHPVKDLETGKIEITAQNHGFAVVGPGGEHTLDGDEPVRWETDFGAAELSHLNLYDRTVEGLVLHDVPGACVQYHPEAGPGPHDSLYLFDRFLDLIRCLSAPTSSRS